MLSRNTVNKMIENSSLISASLTTLYNHSIDMAPIATADLAVDPTSNEQYEVLPSANADPALRSLWYEHGHPWSDR